MRPSLVVNILDGFVVGGDNSPLEKRAWQCVRKFIKVLLFTEEIKIFEVVNLYARSKHILC